jgi:hypothetical protein
MKRNIQTSWHPNEELIVTRLNGKLGIDDIIHWEKDLLQTMEHIPNDISFKILVDLSEFEAENMDVHKYFRNIIPLLLANYSYRIGYLKIFPEANIQLNKIRGITCIAMANVHHNQEKMTDYQLKFSNTYEQYFTNADKAMKWILSI